MNIIRIKKRKIKNDHFDEAKQWNKERKFQKVLKKKIAIKIKIRLNKKMSEK
jgi:hypothetical protein